MNTANRFVFLVLFAITMLFSIFLQPPYEAPDEPWQIQKVFSGDAGVYGRLLSKWDNFFAIRNPVALNSVFKKENEKFSYGNNQLRYNIADARFSYYLMKIFNLFMVMGLLFIFACVLSERVWRQLFFSFCLPASSYYITNITSNFFFIILSLSVFIFIQKKQYTLVFLLGLTCALSEDRGCVSLVIFFLFYLLGLFLEKRVSMSRGLFFLLMFGLSVSSSLLIEWTVLNHPNFLYFGMLLKKTVEYNLPYQTNILKRLSTFFMTLWYLTGNVSFRSFVFDYFLFFVFFFWAIFTKKTDKNSAIALISGFSTFIFISTLIHPITQARYYLYMLPFLFQAFEALLKKMNKSYYMGVFFLLILTVIYSIKVYLINQNILSLGVQFS